MSDQTICKDKAVHFIYSITDKDGKLTVDGNHLLAGKETTFHVTVKTIRGAIALGSTWRNKMLASRTPRQPVTITRPFSASASPIASRLSARAESRKPQVFTTTASAPW